MSRFFFYCLVQLIIATSAQSTWGAVVANPSGIAPGTKGVHGDLFSEETVCCDQQVDGNQVEDKVMVAQLFDIVTGAAKLIYNATDNSKEQEEAAKAAELQKQQEEKKKEEEKYRAQKAMEADEQRRLRLSDPFAIPNEPPAIGSPAYDAGRGQLIGILPGGAGGSLVNPNQGSLSAMPANATISPLLPGTVTDLPGQISVPASQAAAPVGTIIISMEQEPPPANAVAPSMNSGNGQEAQQRNQPADQNAAQAPGVPKNTTNEKEVSGSPPVKAEKVPAPPAKKSDNPFDD